MRGELPPRGTVLGLQLVELPASDHTSPDDGTLKAMAERRRANIARRCWRLVHPDGRSARIGLFVGVDEALAYAREQGWTVLPLLDAPGPARGGDRSAGPRPGRDDLDAADLLPPSGDTEATSPTPVDDHRATSGGLAG